MNKYISENKVSIGKRLADLGLRMRINYKDGITNMVISNDKYSISCYFTDDYEECICKAIIKETLNKFPNKIGECRVCMSRSCPDTGCSRPSWCPLSNNEKEVAEQLEQLDFIRNYISIQHTAPNYYTINGQVVHKEEYDEAVRLFCIKENKND